MRAILPIAILTTGLLWAEAMNAATASANITAGRDLYQKNCSACHGVKGTGGVGVPLSLPDFQYSVSDAYIEKSIRLGRPGRVMPAHAHLSEAEIKQIVKYIRSWLPGKTTRLARGDVVGDPVRGKQLYTQHCVACHGANGQGGSGTGVTFSRPRDKPIIPPALSNAGFLASVSDTEIKAALMNGREGTQMASFLRRGLSENDIDNVVSYVRSFEKKALAEKKQQPESQAEPASLFFDSPYDMQQTIENLKRALAVEGFRFIDIQGLDRGLVPDKRVSKKEQIIYFCNFRLANQALGIDPRIGLFLPCRVTVVERDGKVQIITINPKRLSRLFNNEELNALCDRMTRIYRSIIEEATL